MSASRGLSNRAVITVCAMLATIMQALDTTIANVALPYMQGNLSATQDQINWVLTSYIVAAAIMTPVTGFFAARFGRKRLFLVAVAGFTVSSLLCAMAGSLEEMVLFRLMQGVFGASLVPMSQSVLLDSYPKEKHGSAMAIWGMGVMVGPILGPTLGGWLTETYNWRWVFYINLPVGILAFVGLWMALSESKLSKITFDWFGFLSFSIAIGALQMMLDRGEQLDWFASSEIIFEATLAGLAAYLFLVHTFTSKEPFIDPRIFRDRNFTVGVTFIFVVGIILLATLALLTPYLQNLMGFPVLTAGLILAPRGMGTMVAMMIVGRAMNRVDPRLFIASGLAMTVWMLWEMTGYTPDVSQTTLVWQGVVQGLGLGFIFVPLSTVTFATLKPEFRTQGTGLFSLMRNLGCSIGISVVGFVLIRSTQIVQSDLVQHVTPLNEALRAPGPAHYWNLASEAGRAALYSQISHQASTIAYINDFKFMMIVAALAIPLTLVFSGKTSGDKVEAVLD